jgi:hypothetical protein
MKTIGSISYEPDLHICHAPPAAPPYNRDRGQNRDRDSGHDDDRADGAPDSGTASARGATSPRHALNVTV